MTDRKENVKEAMERHLRLFKTPPQREMDLTEERILNRLHLAPAGLVEEQEAQARSSLKWNRIVFALATAAVVLLAFLVVPSFIHRVDASATVESGDGKLLQTGQHIDAGKIVSVSGRGAMLMLADGSHVEMRAGSALLLERADDGVRVRLDNGGVIVNAGKQRSGHLYVQTKDVTASVVGTVFLVNAEEAGSRVAVIQGEVHVQQGATSKRLMSGEQVTTNPLMEARPLSEEISWSQSAPAHLALLQAAIEPPTAPQDSNTPKWEAVAIKPCSADSIPAVAGARGGGTRTYKVSPGRLTVECMSVEDLIRISYIQNGEPLLNIAGVSRLEEIQGGPAWVHSDKFSDRYRIDAKADGALPDKMVMLGQMLRTLLEDRFQLKIHRETEDSPMYALTVAKGGLKIKPIEGDCVADHNVPIEDAVDAVRRGVSGPCGFLSGAQVGPTTMGWAFGGHTMTQFANVLSSMVHRHVIDQTGVSGRFRIYLVYAPDNMAAALTSQPSPRGLDAGPSPSIPQGPDIFTAIQEQLGLKLVDAPKGSHQYILVDHAERPSEN
jgi:uncharacterized protein (TIGR03435 family)